jgi:hypothetical protein
MTLKMSRAVAAGDLLTGLFAELDAAGQVQVSDNVNGAWIRASGTTYSTGKGDIALYYRPNTAASASGLVITVSAGAGTNLYGSAAEYSGVATSGPLDTATIGSGTGTTVDSGPTASIPAGELVYAAVTANSKLGSITPGASQGITFKVRSSSSNIGEADILSSSAGAQDARFKIGNSVTWYAAAAAFKPAGASTDTTPPAVPAGLTASNAAQSVSLTWNASTDNVGVAGYTIYRNGTVLTTVGGSSVAYADSAVASATTYTYSIDAFDAAGNHSAQSSPASITTLDWTPPSTPTGLTAVNASGGVALSWNGSSDNLA